MQTSRKIAVAGATGRVGHHVVDALREGGHEVVEISRSNGVDVITGEGLADALEGVEGLVDAATGPSPEQDPATRFFTTAARNLQDAAGHAGVERIVVVSIIGADAFTGGYGAAKIAHEQAMLSGPVPARVVRASQFHEFVPQMMEWGTQGRRHVRAEDAHAAGRRQDGGEILAELVSDPSAFAAAPSEPPYLEVAGPREENLVEVATLLADADRLGLADRARTQPERPGRRRVRVGRLAAGPGCHARRADLRGLAHVRPSRVGRRGYGEDRIAAGSLPRCNNGVRPRCYIVPAASLPGRCSAPGDAPYVWSCGALRGLSGSSSEIVPAEGPASGGAAP